VCVVSLLHGSFSTQVVGAGFVYGVTREQSAFQNKESVTVSVASFCLFY
jgi:hypothetical protein